MRRPAEGGGPMTQALCGWWDVPLTDDPAAVTCRLCARVLEAQPPPAEEAPFERGGPYEVPPAARELDARAVAAIESSRLGAAPRRARWRTAQAAIGALLAFRHDGQGIASTSHPGRFERAPRGSTDPTRSVTAAVDALHGVDTALRLAFVGPKRITWTACACCGAARPCEGAEARVEVYTLEAEERLRVFLWSSATRLVRGYGGTDAVPVTTDAVIARAMEELAAEAALEAAWEALEARGRTR